MPKMLPGPPIKKTKIEFDLFRGKFSYESIRSGENPQPATEKKDPIENYNLNYVPVESGLFDGLSWIHVILGIFAALLTITSLIFAI